MKIVEISATFLQKDTKVLFFGLSNERWVNEPSTDISETSNVANYSTEEVRTVPSSSECGDPPRTISADSSASRIFGKVEIVGLDCKRYNFINKEISVVSTDSIVLESTVTAGLAIFLCPGNDPRIYKYAYCRR